MSETESHRRAKSKAAGKSGKTESPLPGGKRLDARTKTTATEVERSGTTQGLERAARRLKQSGAPRKVLQVPQKDMTKAAAAMKKVGTGGTVKNMGGTKRQSGQKPKKTSGQAAAKRSTRATPKRAAPKRKRR